MFLAWFDHGEINSFSFNYFDMYDQSQQLDVVKQNEPYKAF